MTSSFYYLSDEYVAFLSSIDSCVLSNHAKGRKHMRPYVGFLVQVCTCVYFLPLSSPGPKDYDQSHKVRPSTRTILRMISTDGRYLGNIRLNAMVPAPAKAVHPISFGKGAKGSYPYSMDESSKGLYRVLLNKEIDWVNRNEEVIKKKAYILYREKTHENDPSYWRSGSKPGYLKATVDFLRVEATLFHSDWLDETK